MKKISKILFIIANSGDHRAYYYKVWEALRGKFEGVDYKNVDQIQDFIDTYCLMNFYITHDERENCLKLYDNESNYIFCINLTDQ